MFALSNKGRLGSPYRIVAALAGIAVMCIGGAYLIGWLAGVIGPFGASRITPKTNAALCLLLLGCGVVLVTFENRYRRAVASLAAIPLLVGGLTLIENLINLNLEIDQLLATEPPGSLGMPAPNRMGTPASLGIALTAAALLLSTLRRPKAMYWAQSMGFAVCLTGLLGTVGYLYGVRELFGIARFTAIAWPTAVSLLMLGLGVLCASPDDGWMARISARDAGGMMVRRLMLPVIAVPLVFGWLRLFGEGRGWFDTSMGTALLIVSFIVAFSALILGVAGQISRLSSTIASVARFPTENPDPVLRLTADGHVLYVNPAGAALLTLHGWQSGNQLPSELLEPATKALHRGEVAVFHFTCQDQRVYQFTSVPVVGTDYVNLYGRDITEIRRAEEALREHQQRLQATFHNAGVGICEIGPGSRLIDVNDRLCRILDYPRDQLLGKTVEELTAPEDLPSTVELSSALVEGRRERIRYEKRYLKRDGTPIWVGVTVSAVRDQLGRWLRSVAVIEDISKRKQAEAALQASEEKFRAVFEQAAIGMGRVRFTDARWIDVNGAFCQMLGYSVDEFLVTPWPQITHPDDVDLDFIPFRRMANGEIDSYTVEKRFLHKQGHHVWASLTLSLVRDARGSPDYEIAIIEDITDRKRAEDELAAAKHSAENAKAIAEQANRSKDHFLAVLSHELRTPLTPVTMAIAMLQDRQDLDHAVRDTLEMIRRNVELEAQLIDDLLDVSRIARGKIDLSRQPIELCTVIHRAIEVCMPDIQTRRLEFGLDLGPEAPYWIDADPPRLQQVFWNLLKNAIKFTPPGGCVGIRCRPNGGYVTVEVADSGIGLDPESLSRVFNAFEQVERSITRQFGGLGLGLAISKALVELHGGMIEASSSGRGKGATFRVQLPKRAPVARQAATPLTAGPRREVPPLRILLVEDHGVTAKMMRMVLAGEGHTVETVSDVSAALEIAEHKRFDLLLSDLGLPDGSGHELLRALRQRGHRFPAVALSGYGREEDIQRSCDAGFAAHLTKPASREAVLETIAAVAGKSPSAA